MWTPLVEADLTERLKAGDEHVSLEEGPVEVVPVVRHVNILGQPLKTKEPTY